MSSSDSTRLYLESPTIPEGMTVAEYRRARYIRRRRLSLSRALTHGLPMRVSARKMVV